MSQLPTKNQELLGDAVDSGATIPPWLNDEMTADPSLNRFFRQSQELVDLLHRDANRWIAEHRLESTPLEFGRSPRNDSGREEWSIDRARRLHDTLDSQLSYRRQFRRRGVRSAVSVVAAAALLLMISVYLYRPSVQPQPSISNLSIEHQSQVAKPESSDPMSELGGLAATDRLEKTEQVKLDEELQQHFLVTVSSTIEAMTEVGTTLSDRAVRQPLERTIQMVSTDKTQGGVEHASPADQNALARDQIELMRDFKRTADFLVYTFPRQATRAFGDSRNGMSESN